MAGGNSSLENILGKKGYFQFFDSAIFPQIEESYLRGEINERQLRQLGELGDREGSAAFGFELYFFGHSSLSTSQSGDFVANASLSLSEGVKLNSVVKRSSKENVGVAFENQEAASKAVDAEKGYSVAKPQFVDRRKNIIITPHVEGSSLEEIDFRVERDLAVDLVHNYATLFDSLQSTDFPKKPDVDVLSLVYGKHVPSLVRDSYNPAFNTGEYVVHGDFKPSNIIGSSEGFTVIDWAKCHGNGTPELDLAKLVGRMNLELEDEQKLLEESGVFDTLSYVGLTAESLQKAMINTEMIRAGKFARARETSETKTAAANAWSRAMSRAEFAVSQGGMTQDEYKILAMNPPNGVDVSYLNEEPEIALVTSPEHVVDIDTDENPVDSLRRSISRGNDRKKNHLLTLVGVGAFGLLCGSIALTDYVRKGAENDAKRQKLVEWSKDSQARQFADPFERAYNTATRYLAGDRISVESDSVLRSQRISQIAAEYDWNSSLVERMLKVNRLLGKTDTMGKPSVYHPSVEAISLLDISPSHWQKPAFYEMEQNLRSGLEKLSSYRDQLGSDEAAVIQYYVDFIPSSTLNANPTKKELLDPEKERALEYALDAASSAINGIEIYDSLQLYSLRDYDIPTVLDLDLNDPIDHYLARNLPELIKKDDRVTFIATPDGQAVNVNLEKSLQYRFENKSNSGPTSSIVGWASEEKKDELQDAIDGFYTRNNN